MSSSRLVLTSLAAASLAMPAIGGAQRSDDARVAATTGTTTLRLGGLLQAQYASGTPSARATFRLRRAELKLAGDVSRRVAWTLMFDAAKVLGVSPSYVTVDSQQVVSQASVTPASQMLQDAIVSVRLPFGLTLDAGQMRVPLGIAGTQPASRLELGERPMYAADRARGGGLADVRDVGATVRGTVARRVDVTAGLFNGSGESQNSVDRNAEKAVAGRVVVRDVGVAGLQLGAFGAYGGRPTAEFTRRDRLGVETQYAAHGLTLRSEYATGVDGVVRRVGYYAHAGYRLRGGVELSGRVDTFDPDVRREGTAATARARDLLGGLNVPLAGSNSALQLDYGARAYRDGAVRATRQLLVNVQTSW
jgi:hypothetical protein